jgi:prepilin-type N-terminal cleavage/methylation domain-containing protein
MSHRPIDTPSTRASRGGRRASTLVTAPQPAGFTLVELLIVLAIVAILASASMVGYRAARIRGAEASAVGTLQAITQAQFAFAQGCGNQRYAPTLAALGTPLQTTGQAFLSPDMAADPLDKSGYTFVMGGTAVTDDGLSCIGVTPVATYQVTADPAVPGATGLRYFATNTERVLYEDAVSFANNMPETGAPTHGREVK